MALTDFQRSVCRLLARNRIASGESYVAGGAALNEWIAADRVSRDIDVFHDTEEARVQPLGLISFAACGKDPGFNPASILEEAARSAEEAGCCVLASSGSLCKAAPEDRPDALAQDGRLLFHPGRIRGALPQLLP